MNFSYSKDNNFNFNNSIIGKKWEDKKINNSFLNTIFHKIDDGDNNVSEKEFNQLQNIINIIKDSISNKSKHTDEKLLKELNNDKNLYVAIKLSMGDFSVLDNDSITKNDDSEENTFNIITVMKNYSEITNNEGIYTDILNLFFQGKISKEEALERINKIDFIMYDFQNTYSDDEMRTYFSKNILENYNSLSLDYFKTYIRNITGLQKIKEENTDSNLEYNIAEFKESFKKEYNFEISDCAIYQAHLNGFLDLNDLDFDKFKNQDDIDNIIYTINDPTYNISKESLLKDAQFKDRDIVDKYTFNIKDSKIADLINKSADMRKEEYNNLKVEKNLDGSYIIKNIKTGETRKVDINKLTTNFTNNKKTNFKYIFDKMDKIMKWEFAKEVTSLDGDVKPGAAGQYFIETDEMGINTTSSTAEDTYTLSHEIIHAMFATVIDGKNTFNEELNKKFIDTFEKERKEFLKQERLENSKPQSRYQYAATNIHEFVAEAGCLHLLGVSTSQYTIAKYFPESYKLAIEMLDNIRMQTKNRTLQQ